MLNDTFHEVIGREGVVSIVSCADGEAHVVNTWNSYLRTPDEQTILIPAWKMRKTEKNVLKNKKILLTVGSKEVQGRMGPGTGFLLEGTACFIDSGDEYDMVKNDYAFTTRVLKITVNSIKQTI